MCKISIVLISVLNYNLHHLKNRRKQQKKSNKIFFARFPSKTFTKLSRLAKMLFTGHLIKKPHFVLRFHQDGNISETRKIESQIPLDYY